MQLCCWGCALEKDLLLQLISVAGYILRNPCSSCRCTTPVDTRRPGYAAYWASDTK